MHSLYTVQSGTAMILHFGCLFFPMTGLVASIWGSVPLPESSHYPLHMRFFVLQRFFSQSQSTSFLFKIIFQLFKIDFTMLYLFYM